MTFEDSLRIIRERASLLARSTETIPTRTAIRRVLAAPVFARRANPARKLAAMDGIVVDCLSSSELPLKFESGHWERINTGEPIPPQFNCVIKIEDVQWDGNTAVVERAYQFMQNVRSIGEDFEQEQLLLDRDRLLEPQDLALLLCAGYEEIEVFRKPVVTFLPTGSELALSSSSGTDTVIESNSAMVSGLVESWGGILYVANPVPDQAELLSQKIKSYAATSDVLVVSAGTSMGNRDLTAGVLESLGTIYFHGVALNPAKPVLYAEIGHLPVLGLPGYPVSAFVASHLYLRILVSALSGIPVGVKQAVLISADDLPARPNDYYYRMNLFEVEGQVFVKRITQGAGSVLSLSRMDALMHVPANTPIRRRDGVRVEIISEPSNKSIAVLGSGDRILSRLFEQFEMNVPDYRMLFWESSNDEALESIVARSAHLAVINVGSGGPDIFHEFAAQLQEYMLRYRMFTRTVGLVVPATTGLAQDLSSLRPGLRVVMHERCMALWELLLTAFRIPADHFCPGLVKADDSDILASVQAGSWDAAFVDIRFLKAGQQLLASVREHFDLVVCESYADTPPVAKLISILLSESFGAWVETQKGCDIISRGLLEPA